MPVSGQSDPEAQPNAAPVTPVEPAAAAAAVDDGTLVVDRSEHNRVQAENRKLRKDADKAKAVEEQRLHDEKQDTLKAAGKFDEALKSERDRSAGLELRLERQGAASALSDEISAQGFSGEQAAAIKRLANLSAVEFADGDPVQSSVAAAVQSVVQQFPSMFAAAAEPEPTVDGEAPRTQRRAGPAAPVAAANGAQKPAGYISREDYANTHARVRLTPEFQARVALSEPYWPTVVPIDTFQQVGS